MNNGTLIGKLNYFRNYSIFYCFFTIGRYYCSNKTLREEILDFTEKYAVILSLIGIIFMFFPFDFFEMLGIKEIYIAKGSPIQGSFTGRFTTTLYKSEINRIGSIMFEPINFGYFLILPFLSLYYKLKSKSMSSSMKFIIVTIGLVTSFAKGAYMICIFSIIIDVMRKLFMKFRINDTKLKKKKMKLPRYIFLLAILIVLVTVFSLWYYKNVGAAANNHFYAIEQTFKNTLRKPILGYGLGMGGNYGAQEDGWLSTGAESGMMGLIYQLGYPFFIIFASMFLMIGLKNIKRHENFLIAFLPIIFLVVSIFQENTFTPQCLGITFIIAGSIYGISALKKENNSIMHRR
jgi:membrane protein